MTEAFVKPPLYLNSTSTADGFYTKMTFHHPTLEIWSNDKAVLTIPILVNYLRLS